MIKLVSPFVIELRFLGGIRSGAWLELRQRFAIVDTVAVGYILVDSLTWDHIKDGDGGDKIATV